MPKQSHFGHKLLTSGHFLLSYNTKYDLYHIYRCGMLPWNDQRTKPKSREKVGIRQCLELRAALVKARGMLPWNDQRTKPKSYIYSINIHLGRTFEHYRVNINNLIGFLIVNQVVYSKTDLYKGSPKTDTFIYLNARRWLPTKRYIKLWIWWRVVFYRVGNFLKLFGHFSVFQFLKLLFLNNFPAVEIFLWTKLQSLWQIAKALCAIKYKLCSKKKSKKG